MSKKKITIAVYAKDAELLWSLRHLRVRIQKRIPGQGRPPSEMETFADVFKCAVDALEKERC